MPFLPEPIVVLGAARSGTTLLGDLIAKHPDVAYWVEPKYIWRYGRPLARHDGRAAHEATPRVRRYIRRAFSQFAERQGASRFMEKTPSNCFRVPFVHAVLPDARFLHLLRDGRDVTRSAVRKWTQPPDPTAIHRRLTTLDIPLAHLPLYGAAALRDVIGRQLFPERAYLWGPQFPGIREVRAAQGVVATCAIQWRESVLAAQAGLEGVPASQQLEIRFEDVVADPAEALARILDFLHLRPSDVVLDHARRTADASAAARWERREPDPEMDAHLQPLLSELGYT